MEARGEDAKTVSYCMEEVRVNENRRVFLKQAGAAGVVALAGMASAP